MKFKRILIANRSEIAIRVIRACQELNITAVAVYSETDRNSLFYRLADESIALRGNSLKSTYLNIPKIIKAAQKMKCDAIHPGYGFLSENADFVQACEEAGIVFIGPSSKTMHMAGDKAKLKRIMEENAVPVLPSIETENQEEVEAFAARVGYPLIVKPSFGGGGKGMKIVYADDEIEDAIRNAKNIGKAAFGESAFFIEKYLETPRHIEVQMLCDSKGHVVDLGERECTIQRRHQKLIEESPSPALDKKRRKRVAELAKKAIMAVDYVNAGTVEFLFEKGRFYFLEINARVQVEHTVTELVTGVDIVKEQILIARGKELSLKQKDVKPRGWAIQCRINAEDPFNNFMPCPGRIEGYRSPGGFGIRVDSSVFMKCAISAEYDSLVSKLTVWGRDRDEAIDRMRRALGEYVVIGVQTTKPLYRAIVREKDFRKGKFDTGYLEQHNKILSEIMKEIVKENKHRFESIRSIFRDNLPICDANVAYGEFYMKRE